MILPKYNFYVGEADNYLIYLNSYASIDNSGNYSHEATSDKYAFSKTVLQANKLLFFNLISLDS